MSSQAAPPTPKPLRIADSDLMRVTLAQLRAWEAEAAQGVVVPKADEEAWEDTEIDMRRTAL
ncbi:hypothetical protein [Roseateles sp.]|uniref:hypothetical protein n=1 Tax=Roseateles sp. TaxID=1971397 RepID=UPI0039EB3DC3